MPTLTLPVQPVTSMTDLIDQIGKEAPIRQRWTPIQFELAIDRALLDCLPLGVRGIAAGSGEGRDWMANSFRIIDVERVLIKTPNDPNGSWQIVPRTFFNWSASTAAGMGGVSLLSALPPGSSLELWGTFQPVPSLRNNNIEFPWLPVLRAYAIAHLYRMKMDEGLDGDTTQFPLIAAEWRTSADAIKFSLIGGGEPPPEEGAAKKPAPRGKKK